MSHEPGVMPFLTSLGFSITAKCPIACAHCIVEAGPNRREEMDAGDAAAWLRQAAKYRNGHVQSVVITGGEPFYNLRLLTEVLDAAAGEGLVPAVVSNAFWAADPRKAVEVLAALPQIRLLTLSADPYHQRAIPFDYVVNAIQAARELGIAHNAAVCALSESDPAFLDIVERLERIVARERIRVAAIYPAGRALRRFGASGDWTTAPPAGACGAADFPTVFPDGSVIACMGMVKALPRNHPLRLGGLREESLEAILDRAETSVALHTLRLWGPGKLLELLAAQGCKDSLPKRFWKGGYCDLCYALAYGGELCEAAARLNADAELARKTAYARVFYLKEEAMLEKQESSVSAEAPGGSRRQTEPPFLANIGFLITYKCQVACPHCVVGAGPTRTEEMPLDLTQAWIEQAAAYGDSRIKTVCFTGGEPFIDPERLRQMCLAVVSHGMIPTAVTNAFWAATPAEALKVLDKIPALRVISVSTDSHHLKRIPIERVRNAVEAARQLGLSYSVSVCTENLDGREHKELLANLESFVEPELVSSVVTFPAGRGAGLLNIGQFPMTGVLPQTACPGAHTPVVFPDGRVYACIGPIIDIQGPHPLLLGNLRVTPLATILDAAQVNPIVHMLRVWGPGELYRKLDERGYGRLLPRMHVKDSICNLCYSLMGNAGLRAALEEVASDLTLTRRTAWARQYYLGETDMVEALHAHGLLETAAEASS